MEWRPSQSCRSYSNRQKSTHRQQCRWQEELGLTVVVYGSVARRESTLDSDVDLFVVYPDGIDPEARADFSYQIVSHVERLTGNEVQVFSVERTELAQRTAENDPLVANVLADGIHVYGPALRRSRGSTA